MKGLDPDLRALQDVRDQVARAKKAQKIAASWNQERVDRVCRAMAEAGARVAYDLARLAVRRYWGEIAADIAKDSVENVLATASFYARLGVFAAGGTPLSQRVFQTDGARFTYTRMALCTPGMTRVYVAIAASAALAAALLGAAWLRRRVRQGGLAAPAAGLAAWVPALGFVVTNAVGDARWRQAPRPAAAGEPGEIGKGAPEGVRFLGSPSPADCQVTEPVHRPSTSSGGASSATRPASRSSWNSQEVQCFSKAN